MSYRYVSSISKVIVHNREISVALEHSSVRSESLAEHSALLLSADSQLRHVRRTESKKTKQH